MPAQLCVWISVLSSLPLMGIRNRGVNFWGPLRLTTPHGDQKHWEPSNGTVWNGLTTPHGDQKLAKLPHVVETSRTHYPSWGSETACNHSAAARTKSLTTPHGDQKLRVDVEAVTIRETRRDDHSSHYPSWGSETIGRYEIGRADHELTTPHGDQKLGAGM